MQNVIRISLIRHTKSMPTSIASLVSRKLKKLDHYSKVLLKIMNKLL